MQYKANSLEHCDDLCLVALIRDKDEGAFEQLCTRYLRLISTISAKYREQYDLYESSDFIQEGLLGLFCACNTYKEDGGMTFKNYAMLCVENRFRSIKRHSLKKGTIPNSSLVSIDDDISKAQDLNAMTMQEQLESKEYVNSVYSRISDTLSPLEKKVLKFYLAGFSYKQTADNLCINEKAVDNAMCRIRRKISV